MKRARRRTAERARRPLGGPPPAASPSRRDCASS
jgi:hypothetical protein